MSVSPTLSDRPAHADSYWAATTRHSPLFAPLQGDLETEVAIIGAGFTGLSAAWHIMKAGRSCVILEAHDVGWGASGRNGGMAVPRFKLTFPELERKYGRDTALLMYHIAHEGIDTLERIVLDSRLACSFMRHGHLTPIQNAIDVARFEADARWLAEHADDQAPRLLDAGETAARLGTDFYRAAYLEPRGGGLHPLEYCQALAAELAVRGVHVHCATAVLSWRATQDEVVLQTPHARVKVRELIIATNAYSDLTASGSALKRRTVPVASALIATAPLPEPVRARLMPQGNLATDAKRLTNYYRLMPDGRFVFGGRGGASTRAGAGVYRRLARDMATIFPVLAEAPIEYRWYGLVAATLDFLPRIGRLQTRVAYAMGYNGRGVALAALLGGKLAALAMQQSVSLGPISEGAFAPIPFHALRVPAKQVAISWMQLRDKLGF